MPAEGRLLVVSNRLPLSIKKLRDGRWRTEPTSGGLQSAMAPILQRRGGLWIGWPGYGPRASDPGWDDQIARCKQDLGYVAVDLPSELARKFYEGYANQTLWPLFHSFSTRFDYDAEFWAAYVDANRRFRDAVLEQLAPGDTVWIHDYHLMLLPRMLREVAPETRIGFFLHIPFPASELLRILPRRDEVLRGLLGADLVAFQTHADLQHFRASLLRLIGLPSQMDRVLAQGHSTRLEALPIGDRPRGVHRRPRARRADPAGARGAARAIPRAAHPARRGPPRLHQGHPPAAARLPPAAGQRAQAARQGHAGPGRGALAGAHPRVRAAAPRGDELVGEVNGEFGQTDWTPIVYMRRGISRSELVGAVRGGRRRLGHAAAGRDEPGGQGIRRLPARRRTACCS